MSVRDAAFDLANRGFRVHPIEPPVPGDPESGKKPLLKGWPTAATNDPGVAAKLFDAPAHASANIGIATGRGLLVVDVDPGKGGRESIASLLERHGRLPRTVVARTGSGGWHYYLGDPDGVRNSRGKLGPGLDVRGEGGYVVAPPSAHASGGVYRWADGLSPSDVEIAPAPPWLLELLRPPPVAPPAPREPRPRHDGPDAYDRARKYLATMPGAVSGQGGHDATFRAALVLVRGFCLPHSDALDLLASEFNPRCDPPWSERELQHKVESASRDGSLPPGYLLDAQREDDAHPTRHAPPEPPPPSDEPPSSDDAPPDNVRPLRTVAAPPLSTDGSAALAPIAAPARPLTKSYASICQILRTPDLRTQVLGAGELEFNDQTLEPCFNRQPLREEHIAAIRERCELTFTSKKKGIQFGQGDVEKAVLQVAKERRFHPVADYLRGLAWDGERRIDHIAEDFLGIGSDQPLARVFIRKFMVAAVARALDPGCKVDNVLIIAGKQGKKKSTFLRTLAGPEAFSDSPIDLHDKDGKLQMRAVWILEWAELDAMLRAKNQNSVKAFVTSQVDLLRPPFERAVRPIPRSAVITGSTNEDEFFDDPTGNRRFWPVRISDEVDVPALRRARDRLWAEAVHLYTAADTCPACRPLLPDSRCDRHSWWLERAQEAELERLNRGYERQDPWEEPVLNAARRWVRENAQIDPSARQHLTSADLLVAVKKETGQWTRGDSMRVAAILKRAGWRQARPYDPLNPRAPRPRAWEPPPEGSA